MSSVLEPLTSYLEAEVTEVKMCSAELKPSPESFDSGEECSFARLVRVYELLEIEDQELDRCVFEDGCLHVA